MAERGVSYNRNYVDYIGGLIGLSENELIRNEALRTGVRLDFIK